MHQLAARGLEESSLTLGSALEEISACATELDRRPRFPREGFELLWRAGVLRSMESLFQGIWLHDSFRD